MAKPLVCIVGLMLPCINRQFRFLLSSAKNGSYIWLLTTNHVLLLSRKNSPIKVYGSVRETVEAIVTFFTNPNPYA